MSSISLSGVEMGSYIINMFKSKRFWKNLRDQVKEFVKKFVVVNSSFARHGVSYVSTDINNQNRI